MGHADQLLEEYLRVINVKDDEIHQLHRAAEDGKRAAQKQEERWKVKFADLSQQLQAAHQKIAGLEQMRREEQAALDASHTAQKRLAAEVEDLRRAVEQAQCEREAAALAAAAKECEMQRRAEELSAARDTTLNELSELKVTSRISQDALRLQVDAGTAALAQLQAQLAQATEMGNQLRAEAERCAEAKRRVEAACAHHVLAEDHKRRVTEVQQELNACMAKAGQAERDFELQLRSARHDAEVARRELATKAAAYDELRDDHEVLRKRWAAERDKLEGEHAVAAQEARALVSACDALKAQCAGEKDQRAAAQVEWREMQRRLEDSQKQLAQVNIEHLRGIEAAKAEVRDLLVAREHLERAAKLSALRSDELEGKLRCAESAVQDARQRLADGERRWVQDVSEHKTSLAECNSKHARECEETARLRAQLLEARNEMKLEQQAAAAKLHEAQRRIDELQHVADVSRSRVRELELDVKAAVSASEKRVQEALWSQKAELGAVTRERELEVQELRKQEMQARQQWSEEAGRVASLKGELERAHRDLGLSEVEQQRLQREGSELRDAVAKLRSDVAALTERVADSAAGARAHEKEAEQRTKQLGEKAEALTEARQSLAAMKQQLNDGSVVAERLERELRETKRLAAEGEERLRAAQAEVVAAHRTLAEERHRLLTAQQSADANRLMPRGVAGASERITGMSGAEHPFGGTAVHESHASCEAQAAKLRHQLEQQKAEADVALSRLREELVAASGKHERAFRAEQERCAGLQRKLENQREELAAAKADNAAKEKKLASRKAALRTAIDDAVRMQEAIDTLKLELETLRRGAAKPAAALGGCGSTAALPVGPREDCDEQALVRLRALEVSNQAWSRREELLQQQLEAAARAAAAAQNLPNAFSKRVEEQYEKDVLALRAELDGARSSLKVMSRQLGAVQSAVEDSVLDSERQVSRMAKRHSQAIQDVVEQWGESMAAAKRMVSGAHLEMRQGLLGAARAALRAGERVDAAYTARCEHDLSAARAAADRQLLGLREAHSVELQRAAAEKESQRQKLALQHENETAALQLALAEKERVLHTLERELSGAKAQLAECTKELGLATDRAASLEQHHLRERRRFEEERRALEKQLEDCRGHISQSELQVNVSADESRVLRSELGGVQALLSERDSALQSERDAHRNVSRKLSETTRALESAHVMLEEQRQTITSLRKQLAALRDDTSRSGKNAEAQIARCEERLDATSKSLASSEKSRKVLERQAAALEKKIDVLSQELATAQRSEVDLSAELHARRAEVSTLKERCANLESLKNISELSLIETQARERDLLDKMEEMRNAQQLMQLCFDKQQAQLDIHRRMSDRNNGGGQ